MNGPAILAIKQTRPASSSIHSCYLQNHCCTAQQRVCAVHRTAAQRLGHSLIQMLAAHVGSRPTVRPPADAAQRCRLR